MKSLLHAKYTLHGLLNFTATTLLGEVVSFIDKETGSET
jgi:hypothetical protein